MEVKLVSKKFLKPITPTSHNLRKFKISFFDQILFPSYVRLIFYYNNDDNEAANYNERRNKLEQSLSQILTFYYPLAGRYLNDDLSIDCDDSGVDFLEVKVSCKLSRILNGDFEVKQLGDLVPDGFESQSDPLVLVQCNEFECGGIAIGVSLSHRLADAFTYNAFINGWAAASREGREMVQRPSFELPSLFPAKPGHPVTPTMKAKGKVVTKRFMFSRTAIRHLKAVVNAGDGGVTGLLERKFTRVEVVSALLWKALIEMVQAIRGKSRPSLALHAINMRQKVTISIPDNSCGNFSGTVAVSKFVPTDDERLDVELHNLACEIHSSIRSIVADVASASNEDDLFSIVTRNADAFKSLEIKGDAYMFSSWCKFPIYGADFGWGKPTWVSIVPLEVENSIFLLDNKDGEGIEAWVTLDENSSLVFQQNPNIAAFTSKEPTELLN